MPVFKIKTVWDYCTYDKPFFVLVLIIFALSNIIEDYYSHFNSPVSFIITSVCLFTVFGYGLTITRDRINHGVRLPKIMPKDVFILGAKSFVVLGIFVIIQGIVMRAIYSPLGFPKFELEEMLFNFNQTIHLLVAHNVVNSILFLFIGSILFYVNLFFLEMSLAKLADTGKLIEALNFKAIKKSIDLIGWREYAQECTIIILALVILMLLGSYDIPISYLDTVVDVILDLLIFVTQFLGIGAAYAKVKDKQKAKQ